MPANRLSSAASATSIPPRSSFSLVLIGDGRRRHRVERREHERFLCIRQVDGAEGVLLSLWVDPKVARIGEQLLRVSSP
jgi:hypothetical protein